MDSNSAQTDTEVLINGVLYDCASFKHPGGSILKFFQGHGDASEAFQEFHSRSSPKVAKYLTSLPQRPAPTSVLSPVHSGDPKRAAREAQMKMFTTEMA